MPTRATLALEKFLVSGMDILSLSLVLSQHFSTFLAFLGYFLAFLLSLVSIFRKMFSQRS